MKTTSHLQALRYFDPQFFTTTIPNSVAGADSSGRRFYDVMSSAGRRLTSVFAPATAVALTACSSKFATNLESFNTTANASGVESFTDSPLLVGAIVLAIVATPIALGVRHYWSQNTPDKERAITSDTLVPVTASKTKPRRASGMSDFYDVASMVTGYVPHDQFNVWDSVSDRFVSYIAEKAGGITLQNMAYLYEDCYKVLDQMMFTDEQMERQYAGVLATSKYSAHQLHSMHVIRLQTLFFALAKLVVIEGDDSLIKYHLQELPKLIAASHESKKAFKHSVEAMESALASLQARSSSPANS